MTQHQEELDSQLRELLEQLRPVPQRDPEKAALGRANYLAQVHAVAQEKLFVPAVSTTPLQRLNGWIKSILKPPRRKERFSMLSTLTALLVTVALLFGGTGATVYAAQESLPDSFLYPVKTFSEDVRLNLATSEQNQMSLALSFANRRVGEMASLGFKREPIPEQVGTRLQQEMNLALQLAAGMDDSAMRQALEQIRATLQEQERTMNLLQAQNPGYNDPVMTRAREMFREQVQMTEAGLADPQMFRNQVHQRVRQGGEITPGAPMETPVPGGGYGPGPGPATECPNCTPAMDGSGPGPGPMNPSEPGNGPGGYGPGPGSDTCPTCTPAMDGSGPGPGPGPMQPTETPQPGMPGEGGSSGSGMGMSTSTPGSGMDSGPASTQGSGGGDMGGGQPGGGSSGGGMGGGGKP